MSPTSLFSLLPGTGTGVIMVKTNNDKNVHVFMNPFQSIQQKECCTVDAADERSQKSENKTVDKTFQVESCNE